MQSTPTRSSLRLALAALPVAAVSLWSGPEAEAIPAFARQYQISCATCHAAFPRLNTFGEDFRANNYRLPGWEQDIATDTGDDRLALMKTVPLAIRAQSYAQVRQDNNVASTAPNGAQFDLQSPYLIKLLSGAPLSEHMTYYFYGIMAEKGGNGGFLIEDAWVSHDDVFGSGVSMMAGQFQLSDLMFPRETRLTFQDFTAYRMAGITYDRGLFFTKAVGPLTVNLGLSNGNGTTASYAVDQTGYKRSDATFDNNSSKMVWGRVGLQDGTTKVGVFGLSGKQADSAGTGSSQKTVVALDASGEVNDELYWFFQGLWNKWDNYLADGKNRVWYGGFAGVDWVANEEWTFSALYNYDNAGDFKGVTTYDGINMNTATVAGSYYFMRNVKGVIEGSLDMQAKNGIGHQAKEGYLLFGIDTAF